MDLKEKFDQSDTYYLALMSLYFLKDNARYSTISELVYVLDKPNFLNFVQYYGGQDIYVPTSDEISVSLRALLLYQYRVVNKLSWEESMKKAGFNSDESMVARGLYSSIQTAVERTKVGARFLDIIGDKND